MNERDIALRDKATLESGDAINLAVFADLIRADEREACAKVCEAGVNADQYPTLTMLAAAIRARGNT